MLLLPPFLSLFTLHSLLHILLQSLLLSSRRLESNSTYIMANNALPQWDAPWFEPMRTSLMEHFLCTEEEAIERLQALWNPPNKQEPPAPPQPPPPQAQDPPPKEDPRPPPRKKTFVANFEEDSFIPESLPFFLAQYAIDKIKNLDYVDLWYFTVEGILDASKITSTAADDTFGILRTDLGLTLQQVKATRALSRTQTLITQISRLCQEIHDIKRQNKNQSISTPKAEPREGATLSRGRLRTATSTRTVQALMEWMVLVVLTLLTVHYLPVLNTVMTSHHVMK